MNVDPMIWMAHPLYPEIVETVRRSAYKTTWRAHGWRLCPPPEGVDTARTVDDMTDSPSTPLTTLTWKASSPTSSAEPSWIAYAPGDRFFASITPGLTEDREQRVFKVNIVSPILQTAGVETRIFDHEYPLRSIEAAHLKVEDTWQLEQEMIDKLNRRSRPAGIEFEEISDEALVRRAANGSRDAVVRALEGEWGTLGTITEMLAPLTSDERWQVVKAIIYRDAFPSNQWAKPSDG